MKNNTLEIMKEEVKQLGLVELIEIKEVVDCLVDSLKEQTEVIIKLEYNYYKGSGKCWIARVDSKTKKILSFVDAESNERDGNTRVFKTFVTKMVISTAVKNAKSRDYGAILE